VRPEERCEARGRRDHHEDRHHQVDDGDRPPIRSEEQRKHRGENQGSDDDTGRPGPSPGSHETNTDHETDDDRGGVYHDLSHAWSVERFWEGERQDADGRDQDEIASS